MRPIDADALLKVINERYAFYYVQDDPASALCSAILSYVADEIREAETIEPQRMHEDAISKQEILDLLCDNCDNLQAVCAHIPCKQYIAIEKKLEEEHAKH